jgi:ribonuclease HII
MKRKNNINSNLERELLARGYDYVIGIDEVGRGSWAGPVVVGAFVYQAETVEIEKVNDSKKLTSRARREINEKLVLPNIWSIGESSNSEIDSFGIVQAIKKAIERSLEKLNLENSFCLIDGIFNFKLPIPYRSIVKGDAKHYSIAAASIIAKECRDNIMRGYANKYPPYGFDHHVGYGTKCHLQAIKKHGPLPIHRKSYKPISQIIKNK